MSGRIPDERIRFPINFQNWEQLTFLHWPYDVGTVQALVPDELIVQDWEGQSWVGVTPFRMTRVRAPLLPPFPGWRAFPELNVRAYVRTSDGRDGIWFLGMVVPSFTFIAALRSLGLPYRHSVSMATVEGDSWGYRFDAPHPWHPADPWFCAEVTVSEPLTVDERTPMIESLTGRWSAYHRQGGVLWRTPVAHEPWPLRHARISGNLTAPLIWAGLPAPAGDPLVHAAEIVHARLGPPRLLR